jgi:nitroimidazol reductase NimA-like FMN-containing flavoprotein (pyridoxamine 5'-phosphate oxidase superfamily)
LSWTNIGKVLRINKRVKTTVRPNREVSVKKTHEYRHVVQSGRASEWRHIDAKAERQREMLVPYFHGNVPRRDHTTVSSNDDRAALNAATKLTRSFCIRIAHMYKHYRLWAVCAWTCSGRTRHLQWTQRSLIYCTQYFLSSDTLKSV